MAIRTVETGMEFALFISDLFIRVLVALLGALVGVYAFRLLWSIAGKHVINTPDYDERATDLLNSYRPGNIESIEHTIIDHDRKDS